MQSAFFDRNQRDLRSRAIERVGFIDVLPLIDIECLKMHAIVKVLDGIFVSITIFGEWIPF